MHARMRQRVHLVHHKRRYARNGRPCHLSSTHTCLQTYTPLASEKCQQEKRKTVNGEDILFAMTSLGFENYAEALKIYLAKYREVSHSFLLLSRLPQRSSPRNSVAHQRTPRRLTMTRVQDPVRPRGQPAAARKRLWGPSAPSYRKQQRCQRSEPIVIINSVSRSI